MAADKCEDSGFADALLTQNSVLAVEELLSQVPLLDKSDSNLPEAEQDTILFLELSTVGKGACGKSSLASPASCFGPTVSSFGDTMVILRTEKYHNFTF